MDAANAVKPPDGHLGKDGPEGIVSMAKGLAACILRAAGPSTLCGKDRGSVRFDWDSRMAEKCIPILGKL